jgi:hypothetical protein
MRIVASAGRLILGQGKFLLVPGVRQEPVAAAQIKHFFQSKIAEYIIGIAGTFLAAQFL